MQTSFVRFLLLSGLLFHQATLHAQSPEPNYDETKIPPYTLPDPLVTPTGKRITTARQWESQQRAVLLKQFATQVYGVTPERRLATRYEIKSVDSSALGGTAIRKQISIIWTEYPNLPSLDILIYVPKGVKRPPVFVGFNYMGNHSISTEPGITLSTRWLPNRPDGKVVNNRATEAARGVQRSRWPLELIISKGYSVATAYYGDLEPDHPEGWRTGIRSVLGPPTEQKSDGWQAIGVWAWGMSRMLDYLETDGLVDARRAIALGHSRQGKAALWAGAQDTRFAAVIANESGEGGAALSKRVFGETILRLNTSFPHWFCPQYRTYNNRPEALPFDQHQLLALIAPRPLYVASAQGDQWADPKGEFMSARQTDPVYKLYGKKGIVTDDWPPVHTPVGETVRYHIRTGEHDVKQYDWEQFLNFADQQVKK
ncbi:alpha/beta hydrolase family protein [Larkinella humicola]|uniref:Acetylxylan esterase n=1 Tax=Larkinella humicola TaxID=2607654 RepID=A0A5N1JPS4_9BACT|nr:acetylxylan esterase [Larkinella humicola]KAA9356292.1 acetylxylan esterase [Larkinella humicola]